jgi:hypothetical protein
MVDSPRSSLRGKELEQPVREKKATELIARQPDSPEVELG